MIPFTEIIGANLTDILFSNNTFIGIAEKSSSVNIQTIHLVFDIGYLEIFNPLFVLDGHKNEIELTLLIDKKVLSSYSNDEELRIIFDTNQYLTVSLLDKDFIGPEAACFYPNNGYIIVFN